MVRSRSHLAWTVSITVVWGWQDGKGKRLVEDWADDISCAVFGMANVVTLMYYGIDAATQVSDRLSSGNGVHPSRSRSISMAEPPCTYGHRCLVHFGLYKQYQGLWPLRQEQSCFCKQSHSKEMLSVHNSKLFCWDCQDLVEGGIVARPEWLGLSVHLFNTMVVWLDLLVAHPRTFSRRSQHLSLGLIFAYVCWILVCSHFNGVFPYPFLNKLPWPQVRLPCKCSLIAVCWCTSCRVSHGGTTR